MDTRYTLSLLFAAASGLAIAQPGALDPAYGTGGIVVLDPGTFNDVASDVIALANNTALICGSTKYNGINSLFLARLLEDGTLDADFGTDAGYTFVSAGEETYGYAMALGNDGSIYVCGATYPTPDHSAVLLVRFDANGIPDPNFGTEGLAITEVGTGDAVARGILIQDDGLVVLAGNAIDDSFVQTALLLRYLPTGTLDPDYGVEGIVMPQNWANEIQLNDLGFLDNNSTIAVGHTILSGVQRTVFVKTDGHGVLLSDFGTMGILEPNIDALPNSAWAITTNGTKFFVTGQVENGGGSDVFVAKFRDDGSPSIDFGTGGIVTLDMNSVEVGYDVALQPDGMVLVGGTTGHAGATAQRDLFVARYQGDGTPDEAFGDNGHVTTSVQVDFDDLNALAIQPDGKILGAGFTSGLSVGSDNDIAVVRYLIDGTLGQVMLSGPEVGIFPNPSSDGRFVVRTNDTGVLRMAVTDATGRSVYSTNGAAASGTRTLDLSHLAPGHYVVALSGTDGTTTQRVLIAR